MRATVLHECNCNGTHWMTYTLGQAAAASGKNRSTILRSIQKGKISAEKDANGQWTIDPAELHRVYPVIASDNASTDADATVRTEPQPALIRQLERQIEDLREDRDAWREQARRFMLLVEGPARRTWWQRLTGARREPMVDQKQGTRPNE